VEHKRGFLHQGAAYLYVAHDHKQIRINMNVVIYTSIRLITDLPKFPFRLAGDTRRQKQTMKSSSGSQVFGSYSLAMMNLENPVSSHCNIIDVSRR
jgi:hypothetical protein